MKKTALLAILMLACSLGYSQKIKMSKEAKKKYVSEESQEKEIPVIYAYVVLKMEIESGSETMQISIDRGSGELASKGSTVFFPELERLVNLKISNKAEVDVLNFVSESNWDVVSIAYMEDRKKQIRKYYLRKPIPQ